jgi:hypothetical protein
MNNTEKNKTAKDIFNKDVIEDKCLDSFIASDVSFADEIEGDTGNYNEIDVKFMNNLQASYNKELKKLKERK